MILAGDLSLYLLRKYGDFTMETILATAFGRKIDIQRGESDKLTEAAATIFSDTHEQKKSSAVFILVILSKDPLFKQRNYTANCWCRQLSLA